MAVLSEDIYFYAVNQSVNLLVVRRMVRVNRRLMVCNRRQTGNPAFGDPIRTPSMLRFVELLGKVPFEKGGYFMLRFDLCMSTWVRISRPRTDPACAAW